MSAEPLLSLAAGTVLDAGPEATLRAAAAAGYGAAGLRPDPGATLADAARWRRLAGDLGLTVLDYEVVRLRPDRVLGDHLRLLELAGAAGARFLLVVSEHEDPARTRDELAALCAAARGSGVRIALEFMRFTAIRGLGAALGALDDAGAHDAVVLVDALHLHRGGEPPEALGAVAPQRIGYLQLCDAPRTAPGRGAAALADEARQHRLPPGHGELPLAALLAAAPPGLPLSVEVQSARLTAERDPEDRARYLLAATRDVLAHRLKGVS